MNTIDLRQAIILRVKDKSNEELSDIIQDSIGADERALPGLGVLFEMIWQDSSANEQTSMVGSLHRHLHAGDSADAAGLGHS
ncbi:small acid-soluble spore protein I (minor) [Paenibacillus cellulosilyticus]|uniref:Small, acid-soluble spore protein I n=1 Tax=Paenibacillus cellulosilyticus TaxID=375489 RepID=A0A2V2YC95_9BACL|nr:small acid-soluble spore protein SspI [Paenibacillus cellulosilyticus]PWV89353.1 small acid-soluble spore protein I (minor) [Paenibacillus cellulosilyticus]QKS47308.1 small acid-soluble spore protein SspI [Paenibacillus cellulosilyticus]